jgi:MFS family permease
MGHTIETSASLRAPLRHPSYRVLLAGSIVSESGDWLYNVALAVYVFDRTHSAGWVAAATVFRLVPYVILAPLGGVIADRFDRRVVMIWSDVSRAAAMGALAAVAAADGPVILVTLLAFATTALGTAYQPAMMAVTPQVVGETDLAAANALNTLVGNLTIVVGPAVGAALLVVTSPVFAFTVNAITFLAPAVLFAFWLKVPRTLEEEMDTGAPTGRLVATFLEGVQEVGRSAGARVLAGFLLGAAFVYGAQTVALVLVSDERLGTEARGYGYLLGALGAGGVLAAPLVNRLASGRRLGPTLLTGLGVMALPMAALAAVHSPTIAAALMVVSGAGGCMVDVLAVTLLQRALPDELRGRVFGLLDSAIVLAILAGSLVVSPLVDAFGLSSMLVIIGVGVTALAVVGVRRTMLLDRVGAAELDAVAPIVELLAGLPILELAPRPAIEQLAQAATIEEVEAGRVVIAQGEPADDLYAVFAGQLEVDIAGPDGRREVVGSVGPRGYFGEIGLIQGVPRTATVSTMTAARLVRVPGSAFLDALSSSPTAWARALEGATTRLGSRQPVGSA